jgi:hypothetical protein
MLPVLFLLCMYVARVTEPVVTSEDIAVTELYTDLASHGRLLLGPYSRFGWHHPGPVYFYLQAPLYAASNRAGASLFLGAMAINVVALAIVLWTIVRQDRPGLATVVGIACLAFALRAPRFLASPWTPHVTILPMIACLALAAAVASGRTGLLALTAFVATFVVQTDLALGPPIGVMVMLALGAVALRTRRERAVPVRPIVLALCVSAVVWALPLADAIRHRGGNLAALARFFTTSNARLHSAREAVVTWSASLTAMARPDLALAWGAPLRFAGTAWTIPAAGILMALLGILTYRAARRGRVFDAWFAAMTFATALTSVWSLTRVRDDYTDYEVFWLVALGAVAAAIVAVAVLEQTPVLMPAAERWARRAPPVLLAAALIVAARDFTNILEMERRWAGQHDVPLAVAGIEAYLDQERARIPLIDVDNAWAEGVPILLRLRQHHRRVAVSVGSLFIVTDVFAPTGREDAWIRVQPGLRGAPDTSWHQVFDSYWANVYAR